MVAPEKDPLRTLELIVGAIFVLLATLATASIIGAIFGSGSIPGLSAEVCVTSSVGDGVAFQDGDNGAAPTFGPMNLRDGIRWHAEQIQLCDPEPDGATRALGVAGLTVWALAPLLFFGLLWRLLRNARRNGVFADQIPGGLRLLGGFLLGWAALSFVVTGFVNAALINKMTDDKVWFFTSDGFPWLLILLGVAFLALQRVMAQAVVLRVDTEATI
jgi:hypothetical protein